MLRNLKVFPSFEVIEVILKAYLKNNEQKATLFKKVEIEIFEMNNVESIVLSWFDLGW